MLFEPLDFIARLAALAPKPRVHLTRFHGVEVSGAAMHPHIDQRVFFGIFREHDYPLAK